MKLKYKKKGLVTIHGKFETNNLKRKKKLTQN